MGRRGKMPPKQRKAMFANMNKRGNGNGGYGLAPPSNIAPPKPKTFTPDPITFSTKVPDGATLVWMTPQEYIDRVNVRNRMSKSKFNEYNKKNDGKILHHPPFSLDSIEHISRGVEKGDEINIPWLEYDRRNGNLSDQEGFHRAIYAAKLGMKHKSAKDRQLHPNKMPVAVYGFMPKEFAESSEPPEKKMKNVLDIKRDMEIDYEEKR